jgi:hypothetical protein
MKKPTCRVSWDDLDFNDEDDIEAKRLFEKSILGYVNMFNKLPEKGLRFESGVTIPAFINYITYNGIDNHIYVYLIFD